MLCAGSEEQENAATVTVTVSCFLNGATTYTLYAVTDIDSAGTGASFAHAKQDSIISQDTFTVAGKVITIFLVQIFHNKYCEILLVLLLCRLMEHTGVSH